MALLGATIGPGKIDGTQWDGPGWYVPSSVWGGLSTALGVASPYVPVVAFIGSSAVQALQRPDVIGRATITGGGETIDRGWTGLSKIQDSFTPTWYVTWSHIVLSPKTRLTVDLDDADLMFDDPIGVAQIGFKDLDAALKAGEGYPVNVSGQTDKQILFVKIAVTLE